MNGSGASTIGGSSSRFADVDHVAMVRLQQPVGQLYLTRSREHRMP